MLSLRDKLSNKEVCLAGSEKSSFMKPASQLTYKNESKLQLWFKVNKI